MTDEISHFQTFISGKWLMHVVANCEPNLVLAAWEGDFCLPGYCLINDLQEDGIWPVVLYYNCEDFRFDITRKTTVIKTVHQL